MSTAYRCFRAPFTSVQRDYAGGLHVNLKVFIRGALAGVLTVRAEEVPEVLRSFAEDCDAVVRTKDGFQWHGSFSTDTYLVDEYGQLVLTVGQLIEGK